jgi:hypothetical protein
MNRKKEQLVPPQWLIELPKGVYRTQEFAEGKGLHAQAARKIIENFSGVFENKATNKGNLSVFYWDGVRVGNSQSDR